MSVRRGSTIIAGLPIIDGSLNTTSINPIQNQAVANAVNDLNGRIDAIIGGDVYTKDEVDDLLSPKVTQTDINTSISTLLTTLYPVGSVYISTTTVCPLASLIQGSTWELVSSGYALWTGNGTTGSGTTANNLYANAPANTTIGAGLPNITATFGSSARISAYNTNTPSMYGTGAVTVSNRGTSNNEYSHVAQSQGANYAAYGYDFNASSSSSIYGNSATVQPNAYVINMWKRTV